MRLYEEFDRCDVCDGGWFRIETHVLVNKNSPKVNPAHYKERQVYICMGCGNTPYESFK